MKKFFRCVLAVGVAGSVITAADAAAEPPADDQGPYRITATLPVDGRPGAIAVNPITHAVYVVDNAVGGVRVMNAASGAFTGVIPVGDSLGAVALDPGMDRVYVGAAGRVAAIDGTTITTVPVPTPMDIAVDSGTHVVYAPKRHMCGNVCFGDGTVSAIDGTTLTVATMSVESERGIGAALAVDPLRHAVYIPADEGVSVIDGATRAVIATVPVGAVDLAVDPGTHTIYASHRAGGGVSVIDGATNTVTATVPVDIGRESEGAPAGSYLWPELAVDTSDHTVYLSTAEGISIIDPATRTVIASVPLPTGCPPDKWCPAGGGPRHLAVDPGTHTLFVSWSRSVAVIGRR